MNAECCRLVFGNKIILVAPIANFFVYKEHFGWDVTLASVASCALVGMVFFALAWNASADGC